MDVSAIEEVRLTAFKSFIDAVLLLDEMTLLIGRNGSGKSSAQRARRAFVATGDDVRDAIDVGRVQRKSSEHAKQQSAHLFTKVVREAANSVSPWSIAERERFRQTTPFKDVRIWTLENELGARS